MLLAHYKLNDNAADKVVADASGNAKHGASVQNTSAIAVAGKINGALSFNGSTDKISCGANFPVTTNNFSWSLWIYPTTAVDANDGLITKNYGQPSLNLFTASFPTNVRVSINGIASITATGNIINANTWYHIVLTREGTAWKIYVNGNVEASTTNAANGVDYGYVFTVGNDIATAGRFFTGLIDDVRIYDEALTLAQVGAIYNGGAGTEAPYPWLGAATKAHHYRMRRAG